MAAKIFDESRPQLAELMKENVDLVADKLIRLDGKVDSKFGELVSQVGSLDVTVGKIESDLTAVMFKLDSKLERDSADAAKRDRRWRWVAGLGGTICAGVAVDLVKILFPNF